MRKSTLWFIAATGLLWTMTASATIVKSSELPDNKMEVATPPVLFYETDLNRGLVAWYSFSGNANDESGNEHHATLRGATLTSDRFGKPNSAYLFNGKKNTIPFTGTKIKRPQGTLSFWAQTKRKSSNILTLEAIPGKLVITVRKVNHKYELELKVNNKKVFLKDKTIQPNAAAFDFIALVCDGKSIHLMVNNRKAGSVKFDKKLAERLLPYTLKKDPTFCSKAVLDEIRIYSRALNDEELDALFTESFSTPELSYETHIKVEKNSAEIYRTVLSDGGSAIKSMGVCWNTTGDPDTSDNKTSQPGHVGIFKSTLTGLLPATKYYVKAYAINSNGVGFSDEVFEFITLPDLAYESLTDIDGNVYRTITIGTQTWMAENLKTTRYADGTPIADGTSMPSDPGKYYYLFLGDTLHREVYGLLYTWEGATSSTPGAAHTNGIQGACPDGWHVPSYAEKQALLNYLGGYAEAGNKLKEAGEAHWDSPNEGTNETGFTALGSGVKAMEEGVYGVFTDYRNLTYFWTSESYSNNLPENASYFSPVLQVNGSDPHYWSPAVNYGAPVRCIRNNTNSYVTVPQLTTSLSELTSNYATVEGTMESDGGQFRTIRGFCWSTNSAPDTSDQKTSGLDGRKTFTSSISELLPNTRYYVRAYGITSAGVGYGNEVTFMTKPAMTIGGNRNSTQQEFVHENRVSTPGFDFYPNPASSAIMFRNLTEDVNLTIYDAKGKILTNGSIINNMTDVSSLPAGVYYIKIKDNKNTVIKKMIKQ